MDRYIRQREMINQDLISKRKVLIAGAGGLGCFVALELVLAGVGVTHIVDNDVVEEHNLNRQFLYREGDMGKYKAELAEKRLKDVNGDSEVRGFRASWEDLDVGGYDLVFDCLDDWEEKRAIARERRGVIVVGSVGGDLGFVGVLARKRLAVEKIKNVRGGVLGTRVGIVASIMAEEGLKELGGGESRLRDRLLHIDFKRMAFSTFEL